MDRARKVQIAGAAIGGLIGTSLAGPVGTHLGMTLGTGVSLLLPDKVAENIGSVVAKGFEETFKGLFQTATSEHIKAIEDRGHLALNHDIARACTEALATALREESGVGQTALIAFWADALDRAAKSPEVYARLYTPNLPPDPDDPLWEQHVLAGLGDPAMLELLLWKDIGAFLIALPESPSACGSGMLDLAFKRRASDAALVPSDEREKVLAAIQPRVFSRLRRAYASVIAGDPVARDKTAFYLTQFIAASTEAHGLQLDAVETKIDALAQQLGVLAIGTAYDAFVATLAGELRPEIQVALAPHFDEITAGLREIKEALARTEHGVDRVQGAISRTETSVDTLVVRQADQIAVERLDRLEAQQRHNEILDQLKSLTEPARGLQEENEQLRAERAENKAEIERLLAERASLIARGDIRENEMERATIAFAEERMSDALQIYDEIEAEAKTRIVSATEILVEAYRGKGDVYMRQHRFSLAKAEYRRACTLRGDDPDLWALFARALYYGDCPAEALPICEQILDMRRSTLGEHADATLTSMMDLAYVFWRLGRDSEALPLEEKVVALRRESLGEHHPNTLTSMNNLAETYGRLGRNEEALKLHKRVVDLRRKTIGDQHSDTLTSTENFASAYGRLGQDKKALCLQEKVLALRREILGDHHPDTLTSMNNLAVIYWRTGRGDKALALGEEALALRRKILGDRHPDTLTSMNNLATIYVQLGQEKALPFGEETLALRREILGERHPDTLTSMSNLAGTYGELGQNEKALKLQEKVLALRREILGDHHPDTLTSMNNLAGTYSRLCQNEEALALQEKALALYREIMGDRHPDTLTAMNNLAGFYWEVKRSMEAVELCQTSLYLCSQVLGTNHPQTLAIENNMVYFRSSLHR